VSPANLRKLANFWKGISHRRQAARLGVAAPPGEEGFTLIELLIVLVIIPVVIGAVAAALIVILNNTIPGDRNGTSARLADSHDSQITSAYFVRDVQSAARVTTSSIGVCPAGSTNQLLGLQWNNADGSQVSVSYAILTSPLVLVRQYCSGSTFSSSVVSHDVFTGLTSVSAAAGGASGCPSSSSSCAVSGGTPHVQVTVNCTDGTVLCAQNVLINVLSSGAQPGVASIQMTVAENTASNFSYSLTGTPRLTSSQYTGQLPSATANTPFISNGPVNVGNCNFTTTGTVAVNDASPGSITIGANGKLITNPSSPSPTPIYTTDPVTSGPSGPVASSGGTYSIPVVSGGPVASPYQKLVEPPAGLGSFNVVQENTPNWDPSTDASVHVGLNLNQPLQPAIYVVNQGMSISNGLNASSGVLFYVTGGNVNLAGTGNVVLSPLVSTTSPQNWEQTVDGSPAPLPEVVLWVSQNDTTAGNPPTVTLGGNGNTTTITGGVYAPTAAVTIDGGGTNGGVATQSLDVGSVSTCYGSGAVSVSDNTSSGTFGAAVAGLPAGMTDVVDVAGSTPGVAPTGNVSFLVCGPEIPSLGCSSSNPHRVATWNPPAVPLSSFVNSTSQATSAVFQPTTAGAYCFAASYPGDSNDKASADNGSDGCFATSAQEVAAITGPNAGACYGTGSTPVCATPWPGSITGTASGAPAVKSVTLTILDANGQYWDPSTSTFSSTTPVAIPAAYSAPTSTWSYNFPETNFPAGDTGGYTITATTTSTATPAVSGQSQLLNFTWGG
jgi:prepilin-type N-terminal cleavage/methylation domain-containing protein